MIGRMDNRSPGNKMRSHLSRIDTERQILKKTEPSKVRISHTTPTGKEPPTERQIECIEELCRRRPSLAFKGTTKRDAAQFIRKATAPNSPFSRKRD